MCVIAKHVVDKQHDQQAKYSTLRFRTKKTRKERTITMTHKFDYFKFVYILLTREVRLDFGKSEINPDKERRTTLPLNLYNNLSSTER